jgi:hypothetical protein
MQILVNEYDWDACSSAAPDKGVVEEAIAAGQVDEDIAASLTTFALGYFDPPPGYTGDEWAYKLFYTFGGGCHFVELNTAQALGLQPQDPPVEKIQPSYTAEQAIEAAKQGWHYIGDAKLSFDPNTPEGMDEYELRDEFGKILPPSWQGVGPDLYWYLVVIGTIPRTFPPFGVFQSPKPKELYGFNLQKWLDNEWALRQMKQPVWVKGGVPA